MQAVQTGRGDVEAGGEPCSLVCEADSGVAESAYKSDTHDDAGDHFSDTGEESSAGMPQSLGHHPGDIQDSKTPVKIAHAPQVFRGGGQNADCVFAHKDQRERASGKDQDKAGENSVAHSGCDTLAESFADPVKVPGSVVLAAEDGNRGGNGIEGAHGKLF